MSTTTNEMPESAAAAVTEATRIAAQAARNGTETAKASIEAWQSRCRCGPPGRRCGWASVTAAAADSGISLVVVDIEVLLGLLSGCLYLRDNSRCIVHLVC